MSTPGTPGAGNGAPDPFDAASLAEAEPMIAVLERVARDLEAIRAGVLICAVLLTGILLALLTDVILR